MVNPIPIFSALYTPYIHTHMLFSRFYTLLCALVTVGTAYTIYFFLIHHCTNSLSSLHIFVHHCTFCASLPTKTSPAISHLTVTSTEAGEAANRAAAKKSEVLYNRQNACVRGGIS